MFTDPGERALFDEVRRRARLVRYGGDCYAYAQLAMGHVDLVIDTGLQPYDIVAPIAVIEAAGGVVRGRHGAGTAAGGGFALAAGSAGVGGGRRRAGGVAQPLTAPAVMPPTMKRWRNWNSSTTGIEAISAPAANGPHRRS